MGRRAKAHPTRDRQRGSRAAPQRSKRRQGEYTGDDFEPLVNQLRPLGLAVKKMAADGNCLFRAFADQVHGDCEEHQQFRDECCELMEENAEEFELFHADEEDEESESFSAYVGRMRHPGRWGSQLELMALCRRYGVNAIVHQSGQKAYEMVFAPQEARCIQLSYHDGEHYNSIRFAWDCAPGQPAQHLSLLQLGHGDSADGDEEGEDVQQVRECLPPEHATSSIAIRAALARAEGDTSLAAEFLLAEVMGADREADVAATAPKFSDAAGGGAENESAAGELEQAKRPPATGRRPRKKEANDERRRTEAAKCKTGPPSPSEADEQLSLLSKQLLAV